MAQHTIMSVCFDRKCVFSDRTTLYNTPVVVKVRNCFTLKFLIMTIMIIMITMTISMAKFVTSITTIIIIITVLTANEEGSRYRFNSKRSSKLTIDAIIGTYLCMLFF